MADGVQVTRNVRNRLRRQAEAEIPVPLLWEIAEWVSIIMPLAALISFCCLVPRYAGGDEPAGFWTIAGLPLLFAVGMAMLHLGDRLFAGPKRRRTDRVSERVVELARDRQQRLEEARVFYSSAEWRLVRADVIREHGATCARCGCTIADSADLTVDHIRPRSRFPDLALSRSNLQVLCRSCNSSKGTRFDEIDEAEALG